MRRERTHARRPTDLSSFARGAGGSLVKGMEPVALCRDEQEVQKALASGAQVVAFDSKALGVDEAIALADWYAHPARGMRNAGADLCADASVQRLFSSHHRALDRSASAGCLLEASYVGDAVSDVVALAHDVRRSRRGQRGERCGINGAGRHQESG